MPSLNLNFWVEVQIFQIIQILQYMSQGNKKFPSIYWGDLFSRKKILFSLFFRLSRPVLAAELTKSFVFLLFSPIWLLWCHWLLPEQLSSIHWLRYVVFPYIWFQGYQLYLFYLCQISQKCQSRWHSAEIFCHSFLRVIKFWWS